MECFALKMLSSSLPPYVHYTKLLFFHFVLDFWILHTSFAVLLRAAAIKLNHHQTSWKFPHSADVCSMLLTKTIAGGYFYHHLPLFLRHINCKFSIHHFYKLCTSNITLLSWNTYSWNDKSVFRWPQSPFRFTLWYQFLMLINVWMTW
jgi:hypothetical protein